MSGFAHNGHGALADERDRHRVGAHAVACDATGGVGGVEEVRPMIHLLIGNRQARQFRGASGEH